MLGKFNVGAVDTFTLSRMHSNDSPWEPAERHSATFEGPTTGNCDVGDRVGRAVFLSFFLPNTETVFHGPEQT